ncbi:MAG: hypothetical protein ABEJ66_00365, partial [Candidatus Nanohaloarchaea archaeon]
MSSGDDEKIERLVEQSIVDGDRPSDWRERKEESLPDDYDRTPREANLENSYTSLLGRIEGSRTVDSVGDYIEETNTTLAEIMRRLGELENEPSEKHSHFHFSLVDRTLEGEEESDDPESLEESFGSTTRRDTLKKAGGGLAAATVAGGATGAVVSALRNESDGIQTVVAPDSYEEIYPDDEMIEDFAQELETSSYNTLVDAGDHMSEELEENSFSDFTLGFDSGAMYLEKGVNAARYQLGDL